MKKGNIRYLKIFFTALVITFIGMVVFHSIYQDKLNRTHRQQLAFVDSESGEIILFPKFEQESKYSTETICLRNDNGQIVFWGELDYSANMMSGDIFTTDDNLTEKNKESCLPAILNCTSGKKYYLTSNPSVIQIGDYYITFNSNNIQTSKGEENRFYLTVHYCHNH